jgi:protein CMS1
MAPRPSKKTKTSHSDSTTPKTSEPVTAVVPGGDDLEDNLLLDDEYLSDGPQAAALDDEDSDDGQGYLSPDEGETPSTNKSKKRSKEESGSPPPPPPPADSASTKKAKKEKAKTKKKAKLEELGLDETTKDDTALLPLEVALDRLSEKQKKALPNLSSLELDEMRLNRKLSLVSLWY